MQNKRSRLLPIVLGIGVLVIALCAIGLILLYPIGVRFVLDNYPIRGRPNSFHSPGPVLGRDRFERFQFAFSPLQESVTDLRWIEVNPQNEPLLAAVSNGGAVFFDEQGRKVHSVRFTSEAVRAQLILTGDDNQYGFLSRGTWGTPPSFVSRSGQEIWNHGAQRGVNDMATGDLTGDGKLDFAVGFNGFGGINLLDHNGATVWNVKGSNIWQVQIADIFGDGAARLIHSDAAGTMTVRDGKGAVVGQSKPAGYFSTFSTSPWPNPTSPSHCVYTRNGLVTLLDGRGVAVVNFPAPEARMVSGVAHATPVKLAPGVGHHFAIVVSYSGSSGSALYIYDPTNVLILHEILPYACTALATMTDPLTENELLLLGEDSGVAAYRLIRP